MPSKPDDQYSKEEAQSRFETALRAARVVGHRQMKDIPKKRPAAKRKPSKGTKRTQPD
jgi:hypothetical protein